MADNKNVYKRETFNPAGSKIGSQVVDTNTKAELNRQAL